MPAPPKSLPGLPDDYTSTLFGGDTVTSSSDPTFRGKVLRCWADEEGLLPPMHEGCPAHPLDRPLLRGEVGIQNVLTRELMIVPESTLSLFQREFLTGDIVKRSLANIESAVVIESKSEVRLEHVMSKQKVEEWVPYDLLKGAMVLEARDRVIYDEWVGTVEEVFEDAIVEGRGDNEMYRIAEMGGFMVPGAVLADILPKEPDYLPGSRLPPTANPSVDRIIDIRPVIVFITWHALNQTLSRDEQEKHPMPKRFWKGNELKDLIHFDMTRTGVPPMLMTVKFRSWDDERRYGVLPSSHYDGTISVNALKITDVRSSLKLRWQDGSITQEVASDLVPYQNIDDYECWPGDHLAWKGDNGEHRAAVLQSFNPHQRVAEVLFTDTGDRQMVSAMELDPGGVGGPDKPHYGVSVGQPVLLCSDNLTPAPEVSMLGQFETQMDHMWWRNELAQKAEEYAEEQARVEMVLPQGDKSKVDWYGTVSELHLDGKISVKLGNGNMTRVELRNLHLLADPGYMDDAMDEGPEAWADEMGMTMDFDERASSEASWETLSEEGQEEADWMDEDLDDGNDSMEVDEEEQERRDVERVVPSVQPSSFESSMDTRPPMHNTTTQADREPSSEAGPSRPAVNGSNPPKRSTLEEDENWQRFVMLEEAPPDHHFIAESSNQTGSKSYHLRLNKEHRALMSSLPENILVRTYENRTDLMRVLIIGPEGTPYADAPFVFDVYLNPAKFPYEPPVVHFHSHTFGKGRCNPNLYEEGKVCLSVLGTWSGEKSESWSPAKSTLLQVFVSISGLVLVRSPYHCEPAFAKLEGTKEGRVNSRLYSEKAYVLSRSFVRTALERPPTGLEEEIRYLYLKKGRLQSVIDHARRLMSEGELAAQANSGQNRVEEEGENEQMWNADAMGSLTMGAILTLVRTITALENISSEHTSA